MEKRTFLLTTMIAVAAIVLSGCGALFPQDSAGGAGAPPAVATMGPAGTGATGSGMGTWLSLLPPVTVPGAEAALLGQGFNPKEKVTLAILNPDGQTKTEALASYQADGYGNLPTAQIRLPADLALGQYVLRATGEESQRTTQTAIWLRASRSALVVGQTAGYAGDRISLGANSLIPGEQVVVYFDGWGGEPLATLAADALGNVWTDSLLVPPKTATGQYQLVVVGQRSQVRLTQPFRVMGQRQAAVIITADVVPPGSQISIFGYGFVPGEQVEISLADQNLPPTTLVADTAGQLRYPRSFKVPDSATGQYTLVAEGKRSKQVAQVDFQTNPFTTPVELSAYFGRPGAKPGINARGFLANERVELYLGDPAAGNKIASFRADGGGNIGQPEAFALPGDLAGPQQMTLVGEIAWRGVVHLRFDILPALVSVVPAVAPPGTTVSFSGSGFLPDEEVAVYLGGQTDRPIARVHADKQGSFAKTGSYEIPAEASGPLTFQFSGASATTIGATFIATK